MLQITRSADLTMVGATGGAWVAPLGTPSPVGLGTPLAPWAGLGAISDDGLKFGIDEDHKEFSPWGVTSAFRTQITKSVRTFGLTLWETNNPVVKSLVFRIPVTDLAPDKDGIARFAESASPKPDRRAFYFLTVDGDTMEGFYVPAGEVTDRSDVTYKSEEMAGYDITITAYPDASNVTVYHAFTASIPPAANGAPKASDVITPKPTTGQTTPTQADFAPAA
ncbi:phage tail protein [Streptomyces syringium]|uniref:phage tail tube protein n=1 Tax=Streptomyces syringium TaxID=76729 RepID=UPI0033F73DF8